MLMADFLDTIYLIAGIVCGISGIYYLIFANKMAEKVKPNSKMANLSMKERIKRFRICGIALVALCLIALWQLFS